MPTLREMIIKAVFDGDKAAKGAEKFGKGIDNLSNNMATTAKGSSALASSLKSMLTGFATLGGLISFTKAVIATNTQAQQLQATITTLAKGNKELAAANVQMIRQFAVETPFALGQVTNAFIKLEQGQIPSTAENMRRVGNFAAAMGTDIETAAAAFKAAKFGQFSRVSNALGVSVEKMGDNVRLSVAGMTKEVKKTEVTQALLEMADAFPEGMSSQLETLGGKFSNLGDATNAFRVNVGKAGFNEALIDLLSVFIEVTGESTELATVIGKALASATRALTRTIRFLKANLEAIIPILKFVGAALAAKGLKVAAGLILNVASAFKILKLSALKANVAALVIPATIAAVVLLVEDLMTFLAGGDSLIGDFLSSLDAAGGEGADLATFIRDTIAQIVMVAQSLLPILIQLGGTVFEALKTIMPTLVKLIGTIALAVGQLLPLILPVIEVLVTLITEVLAEILPVILELIDAILPVIIGLIKFLAPLIVGIIKFLVPIIKAVIRLVVAIVKVIIKVVKGIIDFVVGGIKGLVSVGKKVFGPIVKVVTAIVKGVQTVIEGFIAFIAKAVQRMLEPIQKAIKRIREKLGLDAKEGVASKEDQRRKIAADRRRNFLDLEDKQSRTLERIAIEGGSELSGLEGKKGPVRVRGIEGETFSAAAKELRQRRIKSGLAVKNLTEEEKALLATIRAERLARIERGTFVNNLTDFEKQLVQLRTAKLGGSQVTKEGEFTFAAGGINISVNGTTDMKGKELQTAVVSGSEKLSKKVNRQIARELRRGK